MPSLKRNGKNIVTVNS